VIAVEADTEEEAIEAAESAIDGYGEGDVWDWHEVGGRWDGHLAGKNVVCYAHDKPSFIAGVSRALESRNSEFRNLRDKLAGTVVTAEESDDHNHFGFPIKDPVGHAQRITESNLQGKAAFDKLMACETIEEYDAQHQKGDASHFMLGYYLRKLGTLVSDSYCFDAMFWDGAYGSSQTEDLWERCEKDPERQWLVVMDLHN
jgi:hypothetical protein